jgi:hypothetical protein
MAEGPPKNSEVRNAKSETISEGQSTEIRNDAGAPGFEPFRFRYCGIVSGFELRISRF